MPVHDWTRVDADTFRVFHNTWLTRLYDALNDGLPAGYYALQESDAGSYVPDLLALQTAGEGESPNPGDAAGPATGAVAAAVAPPRVADRREYRGVARAVARRRHLAVRREDGDRLVALVEIVSAANKDRAASKARFVGKIVSAVEAGVHALVVDLHPPTARDPDGMPAEIGREWGEE